MQSTDSPVKIPLPFATGGIKNTVPKDNSSTVTPNQASFELGFPAITMLPLAAGGMPPYGQDFNGVLNHITKAIRWAMAGGGYKFDAAFSADPAVSGYPKGALLQRSDLTGFWMNTVEGNTSNPDTGGTGWQAFMPGGGSTADFSNTTDVAKGDALLGVKQPFAGAVGRSQHEKNIDTGLYADDFRLPADPDDSLSIQRVMDLGRACLLRANKTYTAYGLQAVAGSALMCPNGRAKIIVPAGAGRYGLMCEVSDFTLVGIWFSGGAEGNAWNVASPTGIADRDGVVIGKAFGTGAGISNITLRNLLLTGFDHAGLFGREVQVGMSFDKRATIDNVIAYSNYVGLWYSPRFEYTTTTNSKGYRNYAGIIMQAGNNVVLASQFEENFENVQMAPGENDGHGSFVGCSLNHAVGIGLNALDIANGHVFTGCQFWFAPIQLSNCTGIRITQSQIRYSPVTVTDGGVNMIDDNWVGAGGLPRTFTGSTFTTFRRNRTTSTDNTIDEAFGDLWVSANALSVGSSFTWNATTDTAMTPTFEYLRYHGVESSFLDASGRVYIPKSMRVRINVRITFATAGAAERPVLKAVRRSFGGTVMETATQSVEAPSSRGECTLNLSTEMICNNGDSLEFTLRSLTGTGITVAAGGFRLVVASSID